MTGYIVIMNLSAYKMEPITLIAFNCISIIWKTNAKRFYLRKLLRIGGVMRVIFFFRDFKIIFISLNILYHCVSLGKNGNAGFLETPQ